MQSAAETLNKNDDDILYNRVIVNMLRLLKVLTGHTYAIDSLETKLREIQAAMPKKGGQQAMVQNIQNNTSHENSLNPDYDMQKMNNEVVDLMGDNEGIYDEMNDYPEMADEIDVLSDGEASRNVLMENLVMSDMEKMDQYKKYTLHQSKSQFEIDDEKEFDDVSSEESGDVPDKDDGEDQ